MLDFLHNFRGRPQPVAVRSEADASRTFDDVLRTAVAEGASDVHCEPKETGLLLRFRIDGEMREHRLLPVQRSAMR
jgi:type II secretory ATPase GspE/PulE/Tfp pilus assembly ATPase PilB-like protein